MILFMDAMCANCSALRFCCKNTKKETDGQIKNKKTTHGGSLCVVFVVWNAGLEVVVRLVLTSYVVLLNTFLEEPAVFVGRTNLHNMSCRVVKAQLVLGSGDGVGVDAAVWLLLKAARRVATSAVATLQSSREKRVISGRRYCMGLWFTATKVQILGTFSQFFRIFLYLCRHKKLTYYG